MNIIGIIPARYASTRFPGKPLADIKGKTMIQRVYEQAMLSKQLKDVIVATDDERIADVVKKFKGKVAITNPSHQSGTDRCAEVVSKHSHNVDAVINIQGDEPFIHPGHIDDLCNLLSIKGVEIVTLIKKIENAEELLDSSQVKVVTNRKNEALFFSRSVIPYLRGGIEESKWLNYHLYYKHIGIYGYKKTILEEITRLNISSLEKAESLEQLRWLENGYKIQCGITTTESQSVDTPKDLERILSNIL
jgi:3-deoxy-manno-octulosonate cytidylyltransferase (CMP-KDO synthetase)